MKALDGAGLSFFILLGFTTLKKYDRHNQIKRNNISSFT